MSANKEFPEKYNYYLAYEQVESGDIVYDAVPVDDWLKRCVEDWEPLPTVWDYYVEYHRLLDWRNKWFKQDSNKDAET